MWTPYFSLPPLSCRWVAVRVNGALQTAAVTPSSYAVVEHARKAGDVVELTLPMSLHIAPANDDPSVQAAMYGPLVLAALLGTEGLTMNMIYGGSGPNEGQRGMPMPEVRQSGLWLEQTEASNEYSLRFKSKGDGPVHTLVPLNQVMHERYSVYVRNVPA